MMSVLCAVCRGFEEFGGVAVWLGVFIHMAARPALMRELRV